MHFTLYFCGEFIHCMQKHYVNSLKFPMTCLVFQDLWYPYLDFLFSRFSFFAISKTNFKYKLFSYVFSIFKQEYTALCSNMLFLVSIKIKHCFQKNNIGLQYYGDLLFYCYDCVQDSTTSMSSHFHLVIMWYTGSLDWHLVWDFDVDCCFQVHYGTVEHCRSPKRQK